MTALAYESKAEFAQLLEDLTCQLGRGGMELFWWLHAASIKVLNCEEHPVRAALLNDEIARAGHAINEPVDRSDRLAGLLARAYQDQPLSHTVIMRLSRDILDQGRALPNALGLYIFWRLDNPIAQSEIDAWLPKIERNHIVVSAMQFLMDRKCKEWPAAQCVADVLDRFGIQDLGANNVKAIWRRSKEMGDELEMEKLRSLEAQEADLLARYDAGPDRGGISFEGYKARLLRLKPKSRKVSLAPKPHNRRHSNT